MDLFMSQLLVTRFQSLTLQIPYLRVLFATGDLAPLASRYILAIFICNVTFVIPIIVSLSRKEEKAGIV